MTRITRFFARPPDHLFRCVVRNRPEGRRRIRRRRRGRGTWRLQRGRWRRLQRGRWRRCRFGGGAASGGGGGGAALLRWRCPFGRRSAFRWRRPFVQRSAIRGAAAVVQRTRPAVGRRAVDVAIDPGAVRAAFRSAPSGGSLQRTAPDSGARFASSDRGSYTPSRGRSVPSFGSSEGARSSPRSLADAFSRRPARTTRARSGAARSPTTGAPRSMRAASRRSRAVA